MASKGSVFKRCGCTEVGPDGKRRQLGRNCPKLKRPDGAWNPRHGTWFFAVSVQGVGGKRQQVVRGGFDSSSAAQAELDNVKAKAVKGFVVNSRLTVSQYLHEWIDSKTDIRPNTIASYRRHIRLYFDHFLGHILLTDLRVHHVADMLANLNNAPGARHGGAATRQRVRASLRSALSDAVRQGLVQVNVAGLVKIDSGRRPKALVWTVEREARWCDTVSSLVANGTRREQARQEAKRPSRVMVWRADQLGAFLDAAEDDHLYALWHLVAHRGLRRGEACGLEWDDVALSSGLVTILRQRICVGSDIIEDDPKSEAGGRVIALDAGTVDALKAHRKRQMQDRLRWGAGWVESGKVFTRDNGEALDPNTVSDRFERLILEADLPPIRLHDLRHGAASLMLAAGVDMKVVQETLGHSSLVLTANTYTSVYPEVSAAAAEAAAALVPRRKRDA